MTRRQLEHIVEEIGRRTGLEYFYIVGTSAILAEFTDPDDPVLIRSRDVDVIPGIPDPVQDARLADRLDWLLGEGSDFELEHHYYVQGISMATPRFAPKDWQLRARPVKVKAYTALCMEIHDLALSKYGAGREKDLEFTAALAQHHLVTRSTLIDRLRKVETDENHRALIRQRIEADFRS